MKLDATKQACLDRLLKELYYCRNHIVDFERYTGLKGSPTQAYEYLTDALDSIQLVDKTWEENRAFARRIADQAEQLIYEYFLETTVYLIESFINIEEHHATAEYAHADGESEDESPLREHYLQVAKASLERGSLFRYKRRSQAMIAFLEAIWAIRRYREAFTA